VTNAATGRCSCSLPDTMSGEKMLISAPATQITATPATVHAIRETVGHRGAPIVCIHRSFAVCDPLRVLSTRPVRSRALLIIWMNDSSGSLERTSPCTHVSYAQIADCEPCVRGDL